MQPPERQKWQGLGRKILLALFFLFLSVTFVFGKRGLLQWNHLRQQCNEMAARNDSLECAIQTQSEHLRALDAADSLELERAARYWGMVRPGEEIYIIKEEEDTLQTRP